MVLPISRSNVLYFLEIRLEGKEKKEKIRDKQDKSLGFATQRYFSVDCLRSPSVTSEREVAWK